MKSIDDITQESKLFWLQVLPAGVKLKDSISAMLVCAVIALKGVDFGYLKYCTRFQLRKNVCSSILHLQNTGFFATSFLCCPFSL